MSECQCVHGTCDDGINGTGSCDCESGYSGSTCSNREYIASVTSRMAVYKVIIIIIINVKKTAVYTGVNG